MDGNTVYVLFMSFPELTGGIRAVHALKTTDNGLTWTYIANLNTNFGYAFNESSIEKYGNGFLVVTRGDNQVTKMFVTDINFNVINQVNLSAAYNGIEYVGRPKLFVENSVYYLLCRDIQNSQGYLRLYRINPATLELVSNVLLSAPIGSTTGDSFYAEYYLQQRNGEMYFNVITYAPTVSKPDIIRKEYIWNEVSITSPSEIINENYNEVATNGVPVGWTIGTAGGTVSVQEFPDATNKSLRLVDTSASYYVEAIKSFVASSIPMTVEYKVYASQTNQLLAFNLRSDTTQAITVIFDTNGYITTYIGSTKTNIQAYSVDTWYDLKVVARPDTDKFDLYINGVKLVDNQDFRTTVSNLDSVRFNTTAATTGTFYIDEVLASY